MKAKTLLTAALLMVLAACNNTATENTSEKKDSAVAEVPKAEAPAPKMDSAASMKAFMDFMTPGDVHKMMASWDGKWTTESSTWMNGPDAPPTKSTGTAEMKMILGGRYQQSTHKGNFNGMPFEGIGTLAYDNLRKVFISTWIDNMGTGVMTQEGPWDEATKSMTLKGTCTDPMQGKAIDCRQVLKIVDDKTQVMEMYMMMDGKEVKGMEIKMTRK